MLHNLVLSSRGAYAAVSSHVHDASSGDVSMLVDLVQYVKCHSRRACMPETEML